MLPPSIVCDDDDGHGDDDDGDCDDDGGDNIGSDHED